MATPRFAVLGHPIGHSLSPQIHQAFAAQVDIELIYDRIDVAQDNFNSFWRDGEGRRLRGANITLPLKQLAFELVDDCGQHAREAQAVNTIVRDGQTLVGYNTDGIGLLTDLMQNLSLPINGKRLLLIGAGGAARGVLGPLLRHVPVELVIANRTLSKAAALLERFRGDVPICISSLEQLANAGRFDGLINATSLGLDAGEVDLPAQLLTSGSWCYDLSYGAAAKSFLRWARAAGCEDAHDGLGMLVEQAAESFRLWHGCSPRTRAVIEQLRSTSDLT